MINLDFTSSFSSEDLRLSAIFKADNFVYALLDAKNHIVQHESNIHFDQWSKILAIYNPAIVYVASKTNHFGHFGALDRIPQRPDRTEINKFTGTEVYCQFDATFLPSNAVLHHFSTIIHHYHFITSDDIFAIHFDAAKIHFYLMEAGIFKLYNIYPFEHQDDLLYYHAAVCKEFGKDPQNAELVVSGLIEENSIAFKQLSQYHNVIKFAKCPLFLDITDETDHLKPYHYFDHFLNISCGS